MFPEKTSNSSTSISRTFKKGIKKNRKATLNHNRINTTLAAKHQEILDGIKSEEDQLPKLHQDLSGYQKELKLLEHTQYDKLSVDQIERMDELRDLIINLEQQIAQLPDKRVNYLLTNADLLLKSSELEKGTGTNGKFGGIKKIKASEVFKKKNIQVRGQGNKIKSKADCLRQFLSRVDPDYVNIQEYTLTEENFCEDCQCFRVLKPNEAKMACPECGTELNVIMDSDKPSLKEPPPETRQYEYKRYHHYCDWLAKIQGKESSDVPEEIVDYVKYQAKREKQSLKTLMDDHVKRYLKKLSVQPKGKKYEKYMTHTTQILFKVNGVPPIQLTHEQEKEYKILFLIIQEPFELFRPDSRSNFSSYSYIIYKFSQLLGYWDVADKMKLLKSKDKLYDLDVIWKKICRHLGGDEAGWVFIPSSRAASARISRKRTTRRQATVTTTTIIPSAESSNITLSRDVIVQLIQREFGKLTDKQIEKVPKHLETQQKNIVECMLLSSGGNECINAFCSL